MLPALTVLMPRDRASIRECRDGVEDAADLERADGLEGLELEEDVFGAEVLVEREERRVADDAASAFASLSDGVERGWHQVDDGLRAGRRTSRKSRPKGSSASGMSFRCWTANGMPMMVMARTSAEAAWASAISQPKKTSQMTFRMRRRRAVRLRKLHDFFAERRQGGDADLHRLDAEGNADDGEADDEAADDVAETRR